MIRGNHDYWWASANKMRNLMGDAITFYKVMVQQNSFKQKKALALLPLVEHGPTSVLEDSHFTPETDQSILR